MTGLQIDPLHHPGAGRVRFGLGLNNRLSNNRLDSNGLLHHRLGGRHNRRHCRAHFGVGLLVSDLHAQQPPKAVGQGSADNGNQNTGEHRLNS